MENHVFVRGMQSLTYDSPEIDDTLYNIIPVFEFTPKFTVTFNFTCNFSIQQWFLPQDSENVIEMGWIAQPNLEACVKISDNQFLDCEEAREILHDQLNHWPLGARKRRELIEFALEKACKSVQVMPESCDRIEIYCPVTMVHWHLYREQSAIDLVTERSMEEGEARMVPALESSIESLKCVVMPVDSEEETCTVCLEEIRGGCEAMTMPCSHVFHGVCIKKWLRASHFCPLCRFEMPID